MVGQHLFNAFKFMSRYILYIFRNYINPYPIDYIDEDLIARYYNDLTIAEEKRNPSNRPRSGCDCHVEVTIKMF